MDSTEFRSTTNIITDELEKIKAKLNENDCNIEEVKYEVKKLIAENNRQKQLEQIEKFRKQPDNTVSKDWMFRIVKDAYKDTYYYPCITYINNNQFTHLTFKDYLRQAISVDIIIRYYSSSDVLIELIENPETLHPTFRFFTYNEKTHKAAEIEDPRIKIKEIGIFLSSMGYPLPKRYVKKLKGKPFNYMYAEPNIGYHINQEHYMKESELEENYRGI